MLSIELHPTITFQNTNITTLHIGPKTYIRQDNERQVLKYMNYLRSKFGSLVIFSMMKITYQYITI